MPCRPLLLVSGAKTWLHLLALAALLHSGALPVHAQTPTQTQSALKGKSSFHALSAEQDDQITSLFNMKKGWTGADGAYSVPVGQGTTVWFFGDTWIGKIVDGRRVDSTMVNNSAAVQNLVDGDYIRPLKFFWGNNSGQQEALIKSTEPVKTVIPGAVPDKTKPVPDKTEPVSEKDKPMLEKKEETKKAGSGQQQPVESWVWPGDGVAIESKMYLFLHDVRRKAGDSSCWGFEGCGHEVAQIDNPLDQPLNWHLTRKSLPREIEWGNAVIVEDGFIYAFGEYPKYGHGLFKHPIVLARLSLDKLGRMEISDWQYLCRSGERGSQWRERPETPLVLMADGAPEMTVSRVIGVPGLFATYIRAGIGTEIVIRHAQRPQGPWGKPEVVYRCSLPSKDSFIYGAKAHPELATRDGEMVITYCRNSPSLKENVEHPEIYLPHAVRILLKGP